MAPLTTRVALSWAFIPGPKQMDAPMNSTSLQDITEHPAADIAATLLAYPGTELVHRAEPSWWNWKARWHDGDRVINLNSSLFEDETTWGGLDIEADCLVGDILSLWSFLLSKHPGIWLHAPDCTMHTQRSFLAEITAKSDQGVA
jgi:hypothetical protein